MSHINAQYCQQQTMCTQCVLQQTSSPSYAVHSFMPDCFQRRMEGWEELDIEEKKQLASLFSGNLHDLVVGAFNSHVCVLKAFKTQRRKDGVALPRSLLPMLATIRQFEVHTFNIFPGIHFQGERGWHLRRLLPQVRHHTHHGALLAGETKHPDLCL